MSDAEQDPQRDFEFDDLNGLGKAVFLTGAFVRGASRLLEGALHRAADIAVESERAFREGLDPNVDEAKILEEKERPRPRPSAKGRRSDEDRD